MNSYNKAFCCNLLVTNVTISTTLSGVGDALQQQYEIVTGDNPNLTWDKKRTLDMSATGTVVGGNNI